MPSRLDLVGIAVRRAQVLPSRMSVPVIAAAVVGVALRPGHGPPLASMDELGCSLALLGGLAWSGYWLSRNGGTQHQPDSLVTFPCQ